MHLSRVVTSLDGLLLSRSFRGRVRSLSFGLLIANHVPPSQNIPLWYSHIAPTSLMFGRWGEVMGGFECFDSSLGAIGFFVWSWVSTPLEYYSVSHVFRVKFYVKVAFTKKQSKVVRRVWAYFSQRDSLLISDKSHSDLSRCLKGDRREEGEDTLWNGRKNCFVGFIFEIQL